jgi:cytochrome c-type biogenesis protein CcmH
VTRLRAALPWLLLVAVVVVVLGVVAARSSGSASAQERVDRLTRELRCPTCQSESVYESRSATADAIRADVARRVDAGESDGQIKQAYVDRYTEWILLTPANDGVGFLVWGIPVVVLVLGAGVVVIVARRGRRADAAPAPTARWAWLGGTAAVAVVAAFALTTALGDRRPGGTVTGNSGDAEPTVPDAPSNADTYTEQIAAARAELDDDPAAALAEYDAAAQIDPTEPEPPAYIGWIYALTAERLEGAEREQLVDRALDNLAASRRLDPDYADAHAFTGLVLLNLADDPAGAVGHLQRFLQLAPDTPLADLVRGALADAVAASEDGASR